MLVLLHSSKVAEMWPQLKMGIGAGLPRGVVCTDVLLENVLQALLRNDMRLWLLVEEEKGLCVLFTGTITQSVCEPGDLNLLIYSLYVHQAPGKKEIVDAFNTLSRTAKAWGCKRIGMATQDERIMAVVRKMSGGVVDTYVEVTLQ